MLLHLITHVQSRLATLHHDERGLTTVEYAVAGGLIALAVVIAFGALGNHVGNVINSINNKLPGT